MSRCYGLENLGETVMETLNDLKSSIRRRFEFIEFCLNWEGKVGRPQLRDQFSISLQQATNDLTAYIDACPGNMTYDPRQRSYVANAKFKPRLISGKASDYFMHLEMLAKKFRTKEEIWINSIPEFAMVAASSRELSSKTLRTVVDAIKQGSAIQCRYASISSGDDTPRTLIPHALASDGHRWHVRAYHLEKDRYGDFVLSRLSDLKSFPMPEVQIREDEEWSKIVKVELSADDEMDEKSRSQLEYEYGMKNGMLRVKTSQAMLFYVLRHYGFNPYDREGDGKMRNKSSFWLKVKNLDEVERCLRRRD